MRIRTYSDRIRIGQCKRVGGCVFWPHSSGPQAPRRKAQNAIQEALEVEVTGEVGSAKVFSFVDNSGFSRVKSGRGHHRTEHVDFGPIPALATNRFELRGGRNIGQHSTDPHIWVGVCYETHPNPLLLLRCYGKQLVWRVRAGNPRQLIFYGLRSLTTLYVRSTL